MNDIDNAIKVLNKYRNFYHNSTDKEQLEISQALDVILPTANKLSIHDDEHHENAFKLNEIIKQSQDDISRCINLLSLDGKGSKTTVKSILNTCIERLNTYTDN